MSADVDLPCRVAVVIGTRPEAIKLAPVIAGLAARPGFECRVVATAQHRNLLDQALAAFHVQPELDLDLMTAGQSPAAVAARVLTGVAPWLAETRPDLLLVQGDTTTTLAAALAAFYARVPVGHVEAGLRTGRLDQPFPEEANRVLVTRLAELHFAPTETSRANLRAEGVPDARIVVTGNTAIDALLSARARGGTAETAFRPGARAILVTAHRRESFGTGMAAICGALRRIATTRPDVHVVFCVHPNAHVRGPVAEQLSGLANVTLAPPQPYLGFVALMDAAELILTDSGGIQEEAPSLGRPVLVLRECTERPEAVAAGTVRLVGTNEERIVAQTLGLLDDEAARTAMARAINPYGDGRAAARIVAAIGRWRRGESPLCSPADEFRPDAATAGAGRSA